MDLARQLERFKAEQHASSFSIGQEVVVKSFSQPEMRGVIEDITEVADVGFMPGKWFMLTKDGNVRWVHHSRVSALTP